MASLKRVRIGYLGFDQTRRNGVVTLVDPESGKIIPIYMDLWDLVNVVQKVRHPVVRAVDMTGLVWNLLEALDAEIKMIVIDDMHENGFYARIVISFGSRRIVLDIDPLHAIAMAMRLGMPIFIEQHVWESSAVRADTLRELEKSGEEDVLKLWLEKITPQDF